MGDKFVILGISCYFKGIMKCLICKQNEARKKYCSPSCIKRAYVLRKFPNRRSSYNNNPLFWESETGIGFKWEKYAAELLKAQHIPFNMGTDLLLSNGEGVDVKVCTLYKRKNKRGKPIKKDQTGWWVFNINKKKESTHWFFCICLNQDQTINKQFLIPAEIMYQRKTGITVGETSQIFNKFLYKLF